MYPKVENHTKHGNLLKSDEKVSLTKQTQLCKTNFTYIAFVLCNVYLLVKVICLSYLINTVQQDATIY